MRFSLLKDRVPFWDSGRRDDAPSQRIFGRDAFLKLLGMFQGHGGIDFDFPHVQAGLFYYDFESCDVISHQVESPIGPDEF